MLYLLAILLPPLAVLMCGKPFQAILNLIAMVTLIGWIPAIIHAMLVVSSHHADQRNQRVVSELRRQSRDR